MVVNRFAFASSLHYLYFTVADHLHHAAFTYTMLTYQYDDDFLAKIPFYLVDIGLTNDSCHIVIFYSSFAS